MSGSFQTYAICGSIRRMGESDDCLNRLAKSDGILSKLVYLAYINISKQYFEYIVHSIIPLLLTYTLTKIHKHVVCTKNISFLALHIIHANFNHYFTGISREFTECYIFNKAVI